MDTEPKPKCLTVAELIRLLGRHAPDLEVELEGCDCYGDCMGAEVLEHVGPRKKTLLLTRVP